jgi:hypothetical protein
MRKLEHTVYDIYKKGYPYLKNRHDFADIKEQIDYLLLISVNNRAILDSYYFIKFFDLTTDMPILDEDRMNVIARGLNDLASIDTVKELELPDLDGFQKTYEEDFYRYIDGEINANHNDIATMRESIEVLNDSYEELKNKRDRGPERLDLVIKEIIENEKNFTFLKCGSESISKGGYYMSSPTLIFFLAPLYIAYNDGKDFLNMGAFKITYSLEHKTPKVHKLFNNLGGGTTHPFIHGVDGQPCWGEVKWNDWPSNSTEAQKANHILSRLYRLMSKYDGGSPYRRMETFIKVRQRVRTTGLLKSLTNGNKELMTKIVKNSGVESKYVRYYV